MPDHFTNGLHFAECNRWAAAVRSFTSSLELCGPDSAVLYNLGMSYWQLARHERAAACFAEALRLEPGNARLMSAQSRLDRWHARCDERLGGQYWTGSDLRATPVGPHHCEGLLRLQDPEIMRPAGLPLLESHLDARQWLSWQAAQPGRLTLGLIEPEHGLIGMVSVAMPEVAFDSDAGHFYYWVGKAFQGRGMGRRAMQLLVDLARHKGLEMLWSVVRTSNIRSRHILVTAGFECLHSQRAGPDGDEFRLVL